MIPEIGNGRCAASITDRGAVDLLRAMVEIRSLSGREHDLAAFLVTQMRALGMRAHIDEAGNAVGSRGPEGRPPDLLLLGHMDTVPGDIPVRIDGDTLHGRGAVDAKGPLATFLVGAVTADLPDHVRVDVVGAVEEESATSRGARHVARGPAPRACIIGEPSAWDGVTIGYKGRLLVDYRLVQSTAHSAGPAPSALDRAFGWWSRVLAWVGARNTGVEGAFHGVQAGLRAAHCRGDGLAEAAELTAGFRLPPGVTPEEVEHACREFAEGAELAFRGPEVAHVADRSNAVVRALSTSIRAQGARPTLRLKTGTSDMNVVGPVWKCPIAAYGPGDSTLDHTPEERVSIAEYLKACRVLCRAIEQITAEAGGGTTDPAITV